MTHFRAPPAHTDTPWGLGPTTGSPTARARHTAPHDSEWTCMAKAQRYARMGWDGMRANRVRALQWARVSHVGWHIASPREWRDATCQRTHAETRREYDAAASQATRDPMPWHGHFARTRTRTSGAWFACSQPPAPRTRCEAETEATAAKAATRAAGVRTHARSAAGAEVRGASA
jgi:hypothetical protein